MSSADIALLVGALGLIAGLLGSGLNVWGTLRAKRIEAGEKGVETGDRQESEIRAELREENKELKAENKTLKTTVAEFMVEVKIITTQMETAASEIKELHQRIAALETELHQEQASNAVKQTEISDLTKQVARLDRAVAKFENAN